MIKTVCKKIVEVTDLVSLKIRRICRRIISGSSHLNCFLYSVVYLSKSQLFLTMAFPWHMLIIFLGVVSLQKSSVDNIARLRDHTLDIGELSEMFNLLDKQIQHF